LGGKRESRRRRETTALRGRRKAVPERRCKAGLIPLVEKLPSRWGETRGRASKGGNKSRKTGGRSWRESEVNERKG